jgi:DNA repair protein RecO (recombination protein O)
VPGFRVQYLWIVGRREAPLATPRLSRTEAVVLRRHDLGEADRIVTLYTLHQGKVRAIAKGVRRPTSRLGGHLELFTRSHVMLARGRNLEIITQVDTIEPYMGLRSDLWRAGLAYYVAELVDRMTEEHAENAALYELLTRTLERIATGRRPDHAMHLFEIQALGLLGFRPELTVCVRCRETLEPVENGFSFSAGGIVCPICRARETGARAVSANALKVMRLYQNGAWATLDRLRVDVALGEDLDQTLRLYVQYIAETQLKSASFVAALRREGLVGQM